MKLGDVSVFGLYSPPTCFRSYQASSMTSDSYRYEVILIEAFANTLCSFSIFVQKLTAALLESVEEEECP